MRKLKMLNKVNLDLVSSLSKTQINILVCMSKKPNMYFSVNKLSKLLKKDRTTIQKSISKLENYVFKRQINLEKGFRYEYRFHAGCIDIIKDSIQEQIQELNAVRNELTKLQC